MKSSAFKSTWSTGRIYMKPSPSIDQKNHLKQELARERFNRTVHVFETIAKFARKNTLRLNIPETLFKQENEVIYVYTDAEGLVRVRRDQAKEAFAHHCKMMRQRVRMSNPSAIAYPKYVAFSEIGMQCTLKHKRDLDSALTSVYMVQRFIPPPAAVVSKTILHWYRTKVTTKHHLTSQIDLKTRLLVSTGAFLLNKTLHESPALDLPFIVSLQRPDTLEVEKVKRVTEEETCLLDTVKEVLAQEELSPDEQLEEMVLSYITGLDGKHYFLQSSRICVVPSTIRFRKQDLQGELLSLRRMSVPLPLAIVPESIPEPRTQPRAQLVQTLAQDHVSHLLSSMDHMRTQAKWIKQHAKKMKFEAYGPDFLPNCIHHSFENQMNQPKIAHYFAKSEKSLQCVERGMFQVFLRGRYSAKIKEIHSRLRISESDFELFVKVFEKAFRADGASPEDVQHVVDYMRTFKSEVVTSRRVSLLDLVHNQ